MDFRISLFVVFFFKVLIGDAAITTLKVGDSFACNCSFSNKRELTWTLQRVNGETVPLVWKCIFPYTNCTVKYYDGNLKVIDFSKSRDYLRNNYPITTELTILHVEQDMLRIYCTDIVSQQEDDNCMMNVVDNTGATSIDSPIHTLNQGDQFTCNCNLFGSSYVRWTLQHVNGDRSSMITECDESYRICKILYNPMNFIIETKDENAGFQKNISTFPMFVSKLTVNHVDKDMLRLVCSSDFYEIAQCLMNVMDYSGSDNGTNSTDPPRMPSTTPSPDIYLTTYALPFTTTPFQYFHSTSPKSNGSNVASCALLIPPVGLIVHVSLIVYCNYRKKKAFQRQNQGIILIRYSLRETPTAFPCSTHVNPPVHQSDNTLTTESQQHTASIRTPAPNDSAPPYSSLLELRVEPPPYTTLTAESCNCQSAPSEQTHNEPPAYNTLTVNTVRHTNVSPAYNQQEPNEPPPPYAVWHIC